MHEVTNGSVTMLQCYKIQFAIFTLYNNMEIFE